MKTASKIYFIDGKLITKHNDVAIYSMDNMLFLEIGSGNLWSSESEYDNYMKQLGDRPKGNCLEIGLGLGISSRCILTYPNVDTLTTVEINKDVIRAHEDIIPYLDKKTDKWDVYNPKKHTIIHDNGLLYMLTTTTKYDFIFLSHYRNIDEDTLPNIKDMVTAAKKCLANRGVIAGWFDPYTPAEYVDEFIETFKEQ